MPAVKCCHTRILGHRFISMCKSDKKVTERYPSRSQELSLMLITRDNFVYYLREASNMLSTVSLLLGDVVD